MMAISSEDLKTALTDLLPGVSLTVEGAALLVAPADLLAVCRCLKETERFSCDYVANLTAVDYLPAAPSQGAQPSASQAGPPDPSGGGQPGRIDVVYHLASMSKPHGPITLKVQVPRDKPVVASVTPIWRGAEFQEREVYDLFGVTFEGHPDLRRILLWDEFKGHPMRKDYVVEDQNVLEGPGS